jgi:hypothetical protein
MMLFIALFLHIRWLNFDDWDCREVHDQRLFDSSLFSSLRTHIYVISTMHRLAQYSIG